VRLADANSCHRDGSEQTPELVLLLLEERLFALGVEQLVFQDPTRLRFMGQGNPEVEIAAGSKRLQLGRLHNSRVRVLREVPFK